jgi:hypothetical protein
MNPATCRPRAAVTPPLPLLCHHLDEEKHHFARHLELTCIAALLCPPLLLFSPWPATIKPPPCRPTGPKGVPWCCAPLEPSASRVPAYRSRAAEVSALSTTSARSSSSTAAVQAPPVSPPHQEGPLESVVRPRLHLCRRWPPVQAEATVIIPRPLSASHRQPSPIVL